jgi:hypothetical protein
VLKNRIINGAMVIDQRNAGASVTPATIYNQYTLDRWNYVFDTASKISIQQNAAAVTPPTGFTNYLGATTVSAYSVTSGNFLFISQSIEGYNVADLDFGKATAKTITISFWVRSSLTGTFGGSLRNSAGNRSHPFTYTISVANTWEQKSVTVAGDTSGTWLTTNGIGIELIFGLGVGSTYLGTAGSWASANYISATGATNVVGTASATFYITGVQLEVGSTATPFERRLFNQELANCQRYFQSYGGVTANDMVCMSGTVTTSVTFAILQLPVTMRTSPTVGYSATSALIVDDNGASGTSSAISTSATGSISVFLNITTGATLVAMRPARVYTNGSSARLTWSAEL